MPQLPYVQARPARLSCLLCSICNQDESYFRMKLIAPNTVTHPGVLAISVGLKEVQTCVSVVVISFQTIHGGLGGSRTRTDILKINTLK